MNRDAIGRSYYTADELADILYANPAVDLSGFLVEDPAQYNKSVKDTWAEFESLREYFAFEGSVEMFDEFPEVLRLRAAARDEVVVVGEDGPRLDLPAVEIGFGKQVKFEQVEASVAAKERSFVQRACGHEVNSVFAQAMDWCVRPWAFEKNFVRRRWRCLARVGV